MAHAEHGTTRPAVVDRAGLHSTGQGMYEQALRTRGRTPLQLRGATWSRALPVERWCSDADHADAAVLSAFVAPLPARAAVLDLGCGPGRHTAWLHEAGFRALGVDSSPVAVALAHDRGAPALLADALGPLPAGQHGWDAVLLLDGNIGIGGDPLLLLCRVRDLLRPGGRVLVELESSGASDTGDAALDDGRTVSTAFRWARLGEPLLRAEACAADLRVLHTWQDDGAAYAVLVSR